MDFILCHIFQLIALKHVLASSYGQQVSPGEIMSFGVSPVNYSDSDSEQTAKDVRGTFVLDDSCIKQSKVGVFSPLV